MNTGTNGSLDINTVLPGFDAKVNEAIGVVNHNHQELNDWWDGLNAFEKAKAENRRTYASGTAKLSLAGEVLDAASRAESVQYSLDKKQATMWNFIIGSQYQYNKNWALRAEFGILGTRTHVISGIQYRFAL